MDPDANLAEHCASQMRCLLRTASAVQAWCEDAIRVCREARHVEPAELVRLALERVS